MSRLNNGGGSSPVYTELCSASHSPTGAGAFEDWDISALIPTGCQWVDILAKSVSAQSLGVRTKGSAVSRQLATAAVANVSWRVKPDASRIIQIFAGSTAADAFYYVVGYQS
jgi:hypothetical protein